ncbi:MAG: WG repeat-containing protein [Cyanobacteria bacterium SZAS LIN-3]|nr:WG repeat-containing protein [Cyanobacteria bacterium SZAS LIN-3]MBS2005735.1 WG repeat-containing protein [Cyanobacteria bacterium SZAS TMP-1]
MNRLFGIRATALVGLLLLCGLYCSPVGAVQKYGVVTESGRWIIEPKYQCLNYLGDGLYFATEFEHGSTRFPRVGGAQLLDSSGKPFPIPLPQACQLHDSLTGRQNPVQKRSELMLVISNGTKEGICDIDGRSIVPPIYDKMLTYSEGCFTAEDSERRATVFIDGNGKVLASISKRDFEFSGRSFHEGVILGESTVAHYDGQPGCVTRLCRFFRPDGSHLQLPPLYCADCFSDGYAVVGFPDSAFKPKYFGFINKNGELLGGKKFASCQSFVSGKAVVGLATKSDGVVRYGVIDTSGNFVVKPIYIETSSLASSASVHMMPLSTQSPYRKTNRISPDMWLAVFESKKFEPDDWKMNLDRPGEFEKLLEQERLIGMSRTRLFALLGEPDSAGPGWLEYSMVGSALCADSLQVYFFRCTDDKISGWKLRSVMSDRAQELTKSQDFYTDDMVIRNGHYERRDEQKAL